MKEQGLQPDILFNRAKVVYVQQKIRELKKRFRSTSSDSGEHLIG